MSIQLWGRVCNRIASQMRTFPTPFTRVCNSCAVYTVIWWTCFSTAARNFTDRTATMPMMCSSGAVPPLKFKMCSIQSKSYSVWQCLPTSRFATWVICQQQPPCSILSHQKCSCKCSGWFLQTIGLRDFGVRSRSITNHVLWVVSLFKAHAIFAQIFVHKFTSTFPKHGIELPKQRSSWTVCYRRVPEQSAVTFK